MKCTFCPRECDADRERAAGFCGCFSEPVVARIAPHYDEEPCISGTRGAGAVFFSGCPLHCVYCQNFDISSSLLGKKITPLELSKAYRELESLGVHCIELVTASHFLDAVIESLSLYRPKVPVVYNSSGYEKAESLKRLDGLVDVYLPDFKYSDSALSARLSSCPDYPQTALSAIREMVSQRGKPVFENGLLTSGVLVRHLVLPSHTKNSITALKILKESFGDSILVSLMSQYLPLGKAKDFPDINRKITPREYEKVLRALYDLDLDGFAQDLSSADKKYVPKWNYT